MVSSNLKRSFATLGVVAGLLAAAGPASADTTVPPERVASSEVFELDTLTGDHGTHSRVQSREPARTVTMLDYMGSPVVTYLKDAPRGDDRAGATGLKSDGNEVAVESLTATTPPSVSLGRENSIEA